MIVVGGGTVDAGLLRALHATGGHLVGADGGADRIVAAGLEPEAVIGDMDSLLDPDRWGDRLLWINEQETTDFEKVLYSTSAPVTVALGMTGGRFDHTLAALDAVARHAASRSIVLVDEGDIAAGLAGPFNFEVSAGERVSVHPLKAVTFRSSEGLRYPLDGLRLAPGERTGTSNSATAGPFSIEPEDAAAPYLVILARHYLDALIERLLQR